MPYRSFLFLFIFTYSLSQPVLLEHPYAGFNREYYLFIPESIEPEASLIFVFHGYSGSAEGIMEYSGMNQIANENGFAVCYPQGTIDNYNNAFFNVGYEFHWNETVDDVGFIISLAQHLQDEYDFSEINTFSTGMSNGGDFSYLLGCQASEYFRAIAPNAGIMMEWIFETCEPERPIPLLEIHGTNDNVSWWDGDIDNVDGWGSYVGVDEAIQLWKEINSCTGFMVDTLPDIYENDGSYVITEKYLNGVNNNEVWLYKIVNGGHDWPGVWGNMDIHASDVIWEFFNQFSLDYQIGDVDYSGSIDIIDLIIVSNQILTNSEYNHLADLNNDGSLNINDLYALIALMLGY